MLERQETGTDRRIESESEGWAEREREGQSACERKGGRKRVSSRAKEGGSDHDPITTGLRRAKRAPARPAGPRAALLCEAQSGGLGWPGL